MRAWCFVTKRIEILAVCFVKNFACKNLQKWWSGQSFRVVELLESLLELCLQKKIVPCLQNLRLDGCSNYVLARACKTWSTVYGRWNKKVGKKIRLGESLEMRAWRWELGLESIEDVKLVRTDPWAWAKGQKLKQIKYGGVKTKKKKLEMAWNRFTWWRREGGRELWCVFCSAAKGKNA